MVPPGMVTLAKLYQINVSKKLNKTCVLDYLFWYFLYDLSMASEKT